MKVYEGPSTDPSDQRSPMPHCRPYVKLRNGENWQDAEIRDVSQREDIYSDDGVDQWRRNEINIAGTRRGPKGQSSKPDGLNEPEWDSWGGRGKPLPTS